MANGTAIATSVPEGDLPPPDDIGPDDQIEATAREMGWKPLDEYRGPPGKWRPAADFIERGETILPIVRDQNRRLTEKTTKLETEVGGLRAKVDVLVKNGEEQLTVIQELRSFAKQADQRGYDRAMAELKTKQREAVQSGNTEAYDQLVEQAEQLEAARASAIPPKPPAPPTDARPEPPALSPATQDFLRANRWFNRDPFLTRKMTESHLDVLQDIQDGRLDIEGDDEPAQYEEAKRRIMDQFPERFGMPPRQAGTAPRRRATSVQPPTPGNDPPPRGPGNTIASIADPTERTQAQEAFNRMKRQMPDYTEKEYMDLYTDPHGDVLEAQNAARKK